MASQFRQDMPPPGGYSPIRYARVAQKTVMTGWAALALYIGVSAWSIGKFCNWRQYLKKTDVEKFDCLVAMEPFINAERDRM